MREHLGKIVLAFGVVIVLLLATVAYKVDELSDIVLVKTFNKITRVHVGSQSDQAGLHFKWPYPFQRIVRYDMRAQLLEAAIKETNTVDKYNVLVSMFCSWRIADPEAFHQRMVETEKAVDYIRQQLLAAGGTAISEQSMSALINTDPQKMKLREIEDRTRSLMQQAMRMDQAEHNTGIEIIRVGIKSISLPGEISTQVINMQKEERNAEAKALEAAGQSEAEAIRARAKTARETILSFADRKAAEIRSRGMQQAAEIYKKFRQEPELAMFLRTLESLQSELQKHAIILLDASVLPSVGWLQTNRPRMADMKMDLAPAPQGQPAKVQEPKTPPPAKDDKKAPTTRPAQDR